MKNNKYITLQYQGTWEAVPVEEDFQFCDGAYGLFDALYHADDDEGNIYGEHCDRIVEVAKAGGGEFMSQHVGTVKVGVQYGDDFSHLGGTDVVGEQIAHFVGGK